MKIDQNNAINEVQNLPKKTFFVLTLKMLISTRNSVMSMAILPGITSGGIKKLTQETTTKSPEGR